MPKRLTLTLEPAQRLELLQARDQHAKPYVRERAAVLLKIASGQSHEEVAATGLLSPYCRQSVAAWVKRDQQDGLAGLLVRKGRGRKPAFFSHAQNLGRRAGRVATSSHAHAGKLRPTRESLATQDDSGGLPLAQRLRG